VERQTNLDSLLYVAGDLDQVNHDYRVAWRAKDDMFAALITATVYHAVSMVPLVSAAQLQNAGNDYPLYIRDHYLQLPITTPQRVLNLARQLTADSPTPYQRAVAIETYVRTFSYTLAITAPPQTQDVVDYFLFDLKQGYCDYYATSMVVLARAIGLPARVVLGYGSGTFDVQQNSYIVTEANAHSWVEVYFPSYGWVEFEPTANVPAIQRPQPDKTATLPPRLPPSPWTKWLILAREVLAWLGRLILGMALFVGSVATIWLTADSLYLRWLSPAKTVAVIYYRLSRYQEQWSLAWQAGDTPYQVADRLTKQITMLAQKQYSNQLLPAVQGIHRLTDLYVRVSYGDHVPSAVEQTEAILAWRTLQWRLWLAWIGMK